MTDLFRGSKNDDSQFHQPIADEPTLPQVATKRNHLAEKLTGQQHIANTPKTGRRGNVEQQLDRQQGVMTGLAQSQLARLGCALAESHLSAFMSP